MSDWQLVSKSEDNVFFDLTEKMEVPGGWIYRNRYLYTRDGTTHEWLTLCYVPSPETSLDRAMNTASAHVDNVVDTASSLFRKFTGSNKG